MSYIDRFDDELQQPHEEIHVGLMLNFKKMSVMLTRIEEETREISDKYPKSELMKIWGGIMIAFQVLFLFSYSLLFVATVPFIFFYGYALKQLFGTWKRFKYKTGSLWALTIVTVLVEIAIAVVIQMLVLG